MKKNADMGPKKTKPKQTQFPKKSNDVCIYLQGAYENKHDWTIG